MAKQTYQYLVAGSILGVNADEYILSENEYYRLYSFFVTYSMCGRQSAKKRSFTDYGWPSDSIKNNALGNALSNVLSLNRNPNFIFTDKDDLAIRFSSLDLHDGMVTNVDMERAVIGRTAECNNYLKLFYRVRDGFAHGKFKLRLSTNNEKMIVVQDDDGHNVTARIVIRLSTLLRFINEIDTNRII